MGQIFPVMKLIHNFFEQRKDEMIEVLQKTKIKKIQSYIR